jgi:sigma-B regulation protein RsbU (phosphoserine phosphatase)
MAGDASGHGMAAGLLMATANATLHAALDVDPTPKNVLSLLNRALCRTGNKRTFMSLFYGVLEPESGRFEYICAGHPFPLLRRAEGEILELGRGGLPLGIRLQLDWATDTVTISAGDLLVLYSDGLAEVVGQDGDAFGYHRLKKLLRAGGAPQAVHDRILQTFDQHLGSEPLSDDLSLVVLQRL